MMAIYDRRWKRSLSALAKCALAGLLLLGLSTPAEAQTKVWDSQLDWATGDAQGVSWLLTPGQIQLTPRVPQIQSNVYLYVTNKSSNDLVQIDPTNGSVRWRFDFTQAGFPDASPSRVMLDLQSNVWVGLRNRSEVVCISPQGRLLGSIVVGKSPRALAIDRRGFLWAGGHGTQTMVKINTTTRQVVSRLNGIQCPYGAATDVLGNVWVLSRCRGTTPQTMITQVSRINTGNDSIAGVYQAPGAYGIATSPLGLVYVSSFEQSCLHRFTLNGRNLGCTPLQGRGRCVAVDRRGNAWVACSHNTNATPNTNGQSTTRRVSKVSASGTLLGSYTNVGEHSVGIAVARSGNTDSVWVFSYTESRLYKLNTNGTLVGSYSSGGRNPYAYSGMAGLVLTPVYPSATGTWNAIFSTGGTSNFQRVTWQGQQPAGSQREVRARTASSRNRLRSATWGPWVAQGQPLQVAANQFIELSIRLSTNNSQNSPTITQATLHYNAAPVASGLLGDGTAVNNGPNSSQRVGCTIATPSPTGWLLSGLFLLLIFFRRKRQQS